MRAKPSNIVALLSDRALAHPERRALTFLTDGDNVDAEFSYGELHARVTALAAELTALAGPGERAILLYPSGPDYVLSLLACFYAGIVAVPAYPPQSLAAQHLGRVVSIARDAKPALVLTQESLTGPLAQMQQAFPDLAAATGFATDFAKRHADGGILGGGTLAAPRGDALAMLQYTSGSTSAPKGVMLTHENLMANEQAIHAAFSIEPDDVIMSWLPLFHDMGLIGTLLQPLYSGVSAVLMPHQRFMERPRRWLEAISRFGGSVSGAPDFAYRLCVQRCDPAEGAPLDLRSWRLAFCGAEPVRAHTLRAFADRFAQVGFREDALYPCYGLAEASLLVASSARASGMTTVSFSAPELARGRAKATTVGPVHTLVSCGAAWPHHELAIADVETGRTLGEGEVGEILVHGPSVARGYWQNEAQSEATFVRREGRTWLRTGDFGFLHEGKLFVTGRFKDMIIVRGQNLYPQDIERLVEDENEVVRKGRVVAFGLEHQGHESIAVVAEVSPRMQRLIDPGAVCRAISEVVARAHGEAPALVALLSAGAVPVTSSGKLQRSACKAGWDARTLSCFAQFGPASAG